MEERWWLVAGLRRVGTWPLDPRLANILSFVVPMRLINLFGYVEGLAEAVGERTDAPDPCE